MSLHIFILINYLAVQQNLLDLCGMFDIRYFGTGTHSVISHPTESAKPLLIGDTSGRSYCVLHCDALCSQQPRGAEPQSGTPTTLRSGNCANEPMTLQLILNLVCRLAFVMA